MSLLYTCRRRVRHAGRILQQLKVAERWRVVAAWSGSSGTTHRLLLHHPLLEQLTVRLLLLELFDGSCLIYER